MKGVQKYSMMESGGQYVILILMTLMLMQCVENQDTQRQQDIHVVLLMVKALVPYGSMVQPVLVQRPHYTTAFIMDLASTTVHIVMMLELHVKVCTQKLQSLYQSYYQPSLYGWGYSTSTYRSLCQSQLSNELHSLLVMSLYLKISASKSEPHA